MEGMIFAAGLGTRLRPLTNDCPKAMIEVAGRPLLEHVILKMRKAGIRRIVVNVHHFAEQIEQFLKETGYLDDGVVVSDERVCLLDTGGGLLKARSLFTPGEPVLIHNVDILSELYLQDLITAFSEGGHYATLVTRDAVLGRGFRFNSLGELKGWENSLTGEQKMVDKEFLKSQNFSFSGIQIVSSAFLDNIIHEGVFSIVDEYLAQAKEHAIKMFFDEAYFLDLGTPEALMKAERYDMKKPFIGGYW